VAGERIQLGELLQQGGEDQPDLLALDETLKKSSSNCVPKTPGWSSLAFVGASRSNYRPNCWVSHAQPLIANGPLLAPGCSGDSRRSSRLAKRGWIFFQNL
jgi:hypothetical protein